jgi:predicted DNA binding CopG/RHH family protein
MQFSFFLASCIYVNLDVTTLPVQMKNKTLNLRISEKRLQKLKQVAASREKTMTQMVEEWIDLLVANIN